MFPTRTSLRIAALTLLLLVSSAHANPDRASAYYEDALARFNREDFAGSIIQIKNALQQDNKMLAADDGHHRLVLPLREWIDPVRLTEWLRAARSSWWTPLVFLGVYIIFSLTFVPVLPLAVAAALTWGWFWGGMIELVAAIVAAVPPYMIARSTASSWIEQKMRERFGINYDRVRIRATSTLFLLRLIPVLPFSAVNYLSGLAAIRPLPYMVATSVGMIPSVFIFTYFVDAAAAAELTWGAASIRIIAAGIGLGALFVISRIVAARLHQKHIHR